jgi:hypothetical protein
MYISCCDLLLQKQNRPLREHAIFSILDTLFSDLKNNKTSDNVIDVREYIVKTVFPFAMSQVTTSSLLASSSIILLSFVDMVVQL